MFIYACVRQVGKRLMSNRIKKLMLIGSLFGFFENKEQVDKVLLSALNAQLSLAYRPEAVELPIALRQYFLPESDLKKIRAEMGDIPAEPERRRTFAQRIVDVLPDWLKYADNNDMVNDVSETIEFVQYSSAHGA